MLAYFFSKYLTFPKWVDIADITGQTGPLSVVATNKAATSLSTTENHFPWQLYVGIFFSANLSLFQTGLILQARQAPLSVVATGKAAISPSTTLIYLGGRAAANIKYKDI